MFATSSQWILFREADMHFTLSEKALAIAMGWSPVTVTVRSSACSFAAVESTTGTILTVDVVLCVSFVVFFYSFHSARVISLLSSDTICMDILSLEHLLTSLVN